jgi:hypothetical protein
VIPPLPDQWDPNKPEDIVQPGDTIIGRQRPGLEDLQQKGGVVWKNCRRTRRDQIGDHRPQRSIE